MRLLRSWNTGNRSGLEYDEFESEQTPPYAILSHTWEDEEVLFAHLRDGSASSRKGFLKIVGVISQARRDGFRYVWVDTCCIDKSSSAELSEAINSMYAWYQNARRCYVYLADVAGGGDEASRMEDLAKSRWFTRGWTLQELLAPNDLQFFAQEWSHLGSKQSLVQDLTRITGIEEGVLSGTVPLEALSAAKKMSWASMRQTTRVEDIAYCLMGIFAVNMPMLYGEGVRAFQRLQEEIMKYSDDHSLFAWMDPELSKDQPSGLLAASPKVFASCSQIPKFVEWEARTPFEMTNRGLRIDLHLADAGARPDTVTAPLKCAHYPNDSSIFVTIQLKKLSSIDNKQYIRVDCNRIGYAQVRGVLTPIFVPQKIPAADRHLSYPDQLRNEIQWYASHIGYKLECVVKPPPTQNWVYLGEPHVNPAWTVSSGGNNIRIWPGDRRLAAAIQFCCESDGKKIVVLLGTIRHLDLGFNALARQRTIRKAEESLRHSFNPVPVGTTLNCGDHQIRVTGLPLVFNKKTVTTEHILQIDISSRYANEVAVNVSEANIIRRSVFGRFGK